MTCGGGRRSPSIRHPDRTQRLHPGHGGRRTHEPTRRSAGAASSSSRRCSLWLASTPNAATSRRAPPTPLAGAHQRAVGRRRTGADGRRRMRHLETDDRRPLPRGRRHGLPAALPEVRAAAPDRTRRGGRDAVGAVSQDAGADVRSRPHVGEAEPAGTQPKACPQHREVAMVIDLPVRKRRPTLRAAS